MYVTLAIEALGKAGREGSLKPLAGHHHLNLCTRMTIMTTVSYPYTEKAHLRSSALGLCSIVLQEMCLNPKLNAVQPLADD